MIVVETAEGFRFVTQPDHADIAGRLADRWGNDGFARPSPSAPVRMAAYAHDTGWLRYDRRPHLVDGAPVDFRGMEPSTWTTLYEEGIDAVVEMDAYAGLLVSMHGAGLRRRRYGLSPSWPDIPPAYADFVAREEARQSRLADELAARDRLSAADERLLSRLHEAGGPSAAADSRLWRNYTLLQAWDTLSLAVCMRTEDETEVATVPRGGTDATLTLEPVGGDAFGVAPYPFDTEPFTVAVPSRTVPADAFDDEAGLVRAYYAADRERRTYTLRRDG